MSPEKKNKLGITSQQILPLITEEGRAESSEFRESIRQFTDIASSIRLWRSHLLSQVGGENLAADELLEQSRLLGSANEWERRLLQYIGSCLHQSPIHSRREEAARLAATRTQTHAQMMISAILLAEDGMVASCLWVAESVSKRIGSNRLQLQELWSHIIAVILNHRQTYATLRKTDDEAWRQSAKLYHSATQLLKAASAHRGEESSDDSLAESIGRFRAAAALMSKADENNLMQSAAAREARKKNRQGKKQLLRSIHHLACTGGTVISKCLAAMHRVAVISEINPLNRYGDTFEPTNPLLLLERSHRRMTEREIREEFQRQISQIQGIAEADDIDIVIRDHSHSDFCIGDKPRGMVPVHDFLGEAYDLKSVVTVRHPLDSYLGLVEQKWNSQFTPSDLEEYCIRYIAFLDRYKGFKVRRYEDFCVNPDEFMQDICELLEIEFNPLYINNFGSYVLSGDSGRSSKVSIKKPPRRAISASIKAELEQSKSYPILLDRLRYE